MRNFKTALITGIMGSGASYMAEYIADNHPEVKIHGISRWHSTSSTNRNLRYVKDRIEQLHECDLTDLGRTIEVLDEIKPDAIFHLASHSNVNTSFKYPLSVLQNNVMSTANLLEALRILKQKPLVIMCSTSEVYGLVKPEDCPIKETQPIQPSNPYAVSKLTQDALSYAYYLSFGIPVIRTRAFTYWNARRHDLYATSFARQVAKIELGFQKELVHGNLDSIRTMINVKDNMEAYWFVAERGNVGDVYNVGGTTVISIGDFLELLKKNAKCNIPTRMDKNLLRPVDIVLQIPDVTKLKTDTGWAPRYTFDETLTGFLKEIREDVCFECGVKYSDYYE